MQAAAITEDKKKPHSHILKHSFAKISKKCLSLAFLQEDSSTTIPGNAVFPPARGLARQQLQHE